MKTRAKRQREKVAPVAQPVAAARYTVCCSANKSWSARIGSKRKDDRKFRYVKTVEFICSCEKYVKTTYCYNIYTSLNTVKLG